MSRYKPLAYELSLEKYVWQVSHNFFFNHSFSSPTNLWDLRMHNNNNNLPELLWRGRA